MSDDPLDIGPEELASRFNPTKQFSPTERETYIRVTGTASVAHITTRHKGFGRRLARHPEFNLDRYSSSGPDQLNQDHNRSVRGSTPLIGTIEGQLPVANLSIPVVGRDRIALAEVVSDGVYDVDHEDEISHDRNQG